MKRTTVGVGRGGQKSRQDARVQSLLGSVTQKKRRVKNTTKREVCEKWIRYGSDTGLSAVNFMHVSAPLLSVVMSSLRALSTSSSLLLRSSSGFHYLLPFYIAPIFQTECFTNFYNCWKFLFRQTREYMSSVVFGIY